MAEPAAPAHGRGSARSCSSGRAGRRPAWPRSRRTRAWVAPRPRTSAAVVRGRRRRRGPGAAGDRAGAGGAGRLGRAAGDPRPGPAARCGWLPPPRLRRAGGTAWAWLVVLPGAAVATTSPSLGRGRLPARPDRAGSGSPWRGAVLGRSRRLAAAWRWLPALARDGPPVRRPGGRGRRTSRPTAHRRTATSLDLWKAIDEGRDPTAGPLMHTLATSIVREPQERPDVATPRQHPRSLDRGRRRDGRLRRRRRRR